MFKYHVRMGESDPNSTSYSRLLPHPFPLPLPPSVTAFGPGMWSDLGGAQDASSTLQVASLIIIHQESQTKGTISKESLHTHTHTHTHPHSHTHTHTHPHTHTPTLTKRRSLNHLKDGSVSRIAQRFLSSCSSSHGCLLLVWFTRSPKEHTHTHTHTHTHKTQNTEPSIGSLCRSMSECKGVQSVTHTKQGAPHLVLSLLCSNVCVLLCVFVRR